MLLEAYQDRSRRASRVRELKGQGYAVTVRTSTGSQLHPEYVTDYQGTYQTGFGNTDYLRMWGKLYHLEARLI